MMIFHLDDGHFKDENNTDLFQILVESTGLETSQELQAHDLQVAAPGLKWKLVKTIIANFKRSPFMKNFFNFHSKPDGKS